MSFMSVVMLFARAGRLQQSLMSKVGSAMRSLSEFHFAFGVIAAAVVGVTVTAQCTNVWEPGGGFPGVNGTVAASTLWDPDGAGPATVRVVIVGNFSIVADTLASWVAVWDPATSTWSSLNATVYGSPHVPAEVNAVVGMPNGDLVVGGKFSGMAGSGFGSNLARWDGSTWSVLGGGVTHVNQSSVNVLALAALPNGHLVVGGRFTSAGGVPVNNVALWNGATWSPMGSGFYSLTNSSGIRALTVLANGDVVAGGSTYNPGVGSVAVLSRWNGIAWQPMGSLPNGLVMALTVFPNGNLVAGGDFTTIGGVAANRVARWDGTSWTALGTGINSSVFTLAVTANGDLVAGGLTMAGGNPFNGVARWNGSSWSGLGTGTDGIVRSLVALPNGGLLAMGGFYTAGGAPAVNVARWSGTTWSAMSTGLSDRVTSLVTLPNGDVVVSGEFFVVGGIFVNHIARWDGSSWSALGSGLNTAASCMSVAANGDIFVGGNFSLAGGVPAYGIARWDGTAWFPLGIGIGNFGFVNAMVLTGGGDVIVAGHFTSAGGVAVQNVARWDGLSWQGLGSGLGSGAFDYVFALATLPNGDLVASGTFTSAGGVAAAHIARWNGSSWSALGAGLSSPAYALMTTASGDLIAGGAFATAGGIAVNSVARWDGAAWSALGSGLGPDGVNVLATLANGDVVAGGAITIAPGIEGHRFARWNGLSWAPMGEIMGAPASAVTTRSNGDLLVGGGFLWVDQFVSVYLATLTTTCPASVVAYGAGCVGAGGLNALASVSLPWIGANLRSRSTGLLANSLVVEVLGLGALSLPLVNLVPQGLPGCTLQVTPDVLLTRTASANGTLDLQHVLPLDPAWVGQVLRQQVVALEFAAVGSISAISATNALALTIGSF